MGSRIITEAQIAEAKKAADQKLAIYRDLKAQKSNAARRDKRKQDDRRKILIGAWALSEMQKNSDFKRLAVDGLERFLTREIDRAVFPKVAAKQENGALRAN